MMTLTNALCFLFIVGICFITDIEEGKEFKRAHGYTRSQLKKLKRMMRDSSYPTSKKSAWIDPSVKKELTTFNYN